MAALIILLVIVIIIASMLIYAKIKISELFSMWFGTGSIMEGLKLLKIRREELEVEPKTPFGMDVLVIPQIEKDFPYMNIEEMKKLAEKKIIEYLNSQKDKTYQEINIHKTVTNQYSKNSSTCKLVFQSSVGFREIVAQNSHQKEVRMNVEFIYIYDNTHLKSGEAISLNCPNCGAPIKGLGHKVCPYCDTGLIDLATKTWKFQKVTIL